MPSPRPGEIGKITFSLRVLIAVHCIERCKDTFKKDGLLSGNFDVKLLINDITRIGKGLDINEQQLLQKLDEMQDNDLILELK